MKFNRVEDLMRGMLRSSTRRTLLAAVAGGVLGLAIREHAPDNTGGNLAAAPKPRTPTPRPTSTPPDADHCANLNATADH